MTETPPSAPPPAAPRRPLIARGEQGVLVLLALAVVAGVLYRAATYLGWGTPPLHVEPPPGGPVLRVDVNTADWPTLSLVPGLGPALSHRIVDLRETLPGRRFASLDDLKQVRGISDKVLARLRPYLVLGDDAAAASEPVRIEGAP